MKILVNTSNLVIGGAIQVALSLINEFSKREDSLYYVIICSKQIQAQINIESFPKNFKFYVLEKSPSKLRTRRRTVLKLDNIERSEKPDIVFSVFGPTYWTPKTKHLMGFALGLITNPKSLFYKKISLKNRIHLFLLNNYQRYYTLKNSNIFWCETEDVKSKMIKYLGLKNSNIFVIGNTHASYYKENYDRVFNLPKRSKSEFRLITISANYLHKNLSIILEVSKIMKEKGLNVKFYLTLPKADFNNLFHNADKLGILNLGIVDAKDCPFIYEQADALFLPTLIESFTASFPEAMIMKKPILTSNLSFAREICKDAALYFEPLDPVDISKKIILLMENDEKRFQLIQNGLERVKSFPNSHERADFIITTLKTILKKIN
tara:strand:+ start:143525 stop:144658 length:1134 start_codon:yes stop_codon:yes gene_type:complete